jgi:hypothetical protein
MEIDACLQSLFYLSSRVPSKGGSPNRVPTDRDAPPPESLSTISQSTWWMSLLQFAQLSPIKRDAHPHSLSFIIFRVPSNGAPLQVLLTELP